MKVEATLKHRSKVIQLEEGGTRIPAWAQTDCYGDILQELDWGAVRGRHGEKYISDFGTQISVLALHYCNSLDLY